MGKLIKTIALLLTLMVAITCLTSLTDKSANAQTATPSPSPIPSPTPSLTSGFSPTPSPNPTSTPIIPKPSVPKFTVSLVDHSYDTTPITTSTTNPYNNKTTITTTPSYHVTNVTVDLTIVNQPYPISIDGNPSFVFYNVRTKGHYGQDWTELFPYYGNSPTQSTSSEYTIISIPSNYQVGDELDIQVQAAIGYKIVTYIAHPPIPNVYTESVDFQHTSSDWSPTQTFTMSDTTNVAPSNAPPASSPTVPELSWLVIVPLLFLVLSAAALTKYRKVIDG